MWIFKSLSSREFRFGRCLCLCFYCAMRTEKWVAGLCTTSALVFLPPFPLAAAALHVAVLPKCKRDRPTRRSSTASPTPHSVSWAWMRHLFIVFLISWQTAWIYSLLRLGTWMTVHSHNKRKSGEGGLRLHLQYPLLLRTVRWGEAMEWHEPRGGRPADKYAAVVIISPVQSPVIRRRV